MNPKAFARLLASLVLIYAGMLFVLLAIIAYILPVLLRGD
jgi:hypothetical protein